MFPGKSFNGRQYQRVPFAERFWKKVQKTDGCWLWLGGTIEFGHGRLADWPTRRSVGAHRFSWEFHNGPIPEGMFVCHHCDVPRCVRPDHLFLGTNADNMRDMKQKDRAARGERNGQVKLVEEQVRAIYQRAVNGEQSSVIASAYGTSTTHVRQITRCERWKHLGLVPVKAGHLSGNAFKTHCRNGHPFTPENTRKTTNGKRACRACGRTRKAATTPIETQDAR